MDIYGKLLADENFMGVYRGEALRGATLLAYQSGRGGERAINEALKLSEELQSWVHALQGVDKLFELVGGQPGAARRRGGENPQGVSASR